MGSFLQFLIYDAIARFECENRFRDEGWLISNAVFLQALWSGAHAHICSVCVGCCTVRIRCLSSEHLNRTSDIQSLASIFYCEVCCSTVILHSTITYLLDCNVEYMPVYIVHASPAMNYFCTFMISYQ